MAVVDLPIAPADDLRGFIASRPLTGRETGAELSRVIRNAKEAQCLDMALATLAAIAGESGAARVGDARASARNTLLAIDVIRGDQPITAIETD